MEQPIFQHLRLLSIVVKMSMQSRYEDLQSVTGIRPPAAAVDCSLCGMESMASVGGISLASLTPLRGCSFQIES